MTQEQFEALGIEKSLAKKAADESKKELEGYVAKETYDTTEQQRKQRLSRHQRQHRKHQRAHRRHHHQLAGSHARLFPIAMAKILRRDDRAARRHRRENRVDEHVNHIHQRHAGNRRLAHGGNHHRISHAHRAHKHLIDDQRNNQPL